jgi:hypothetical protein
MAEATEFEASERAMGHIVDAAWSSGATGFRFDLLSGDHDASPLLTPVNRAIAQYAAWLPHLAMDPKSSVRFVSRAGLAVHVDL